MFDDASYTVTFVSFQTICASPASDCSSRRPPFAFIQSRPVAPVISAEPAWPVSAPDGKRLFVKVIRAVTPVGSAAPSASWIACGERLRRRRRATAAAGGDGDGAADEHDDERDGERDQAGG